MKKILLFLFGLVALVGATQQTLSGSSSGWTVAATDTIIINGNATIDSDVSCVAFWMPGGTAHTLTKSGTRTMSLSGGGNCLIDSTTGATSWPDSVAITGNGSVLISSLAGTPKFTALAVFGDNTVQWRKSGGSVSRCFYGAYSGKTTTWATPAGESASVKSYRGNGGITQCNGVLILNSSSPISYSAASTWTSSGGYWLGIQATNSGTVSIPKIKFTSGTSRQLEFEGYEGKTIEYQFTDTIKVTGQLSIFNRKSNDTTIVNTGGFPVVVTGIFSPNALNAGGKDSVYMGSSICSYGSFNTDPFADLGGIRINWGSSQNTYSGNIQFDTDDKSYGGNSLHTVVTASTVKTGNINGCLGDFTVNAAGNTVEGLDSILLNSGDFTVSAGTAVWINKTIRCADYTIASGATIRDTGSLVYISGNAAFGNTATKTKGTGKYILSSGTTHTFASGTGAQKFDTISQLGSCAYSGVDTMKLQMSVGVLATGGTHVFSSGYDIEGSSGALDSLTSMTIDIPADDSVDYVYLANVTLNASDSLFMGVNSVNGGGNSGNIIWPATDTVPIITSITPDSVYFNDSIWVRGTTFGAAPTVYLDGGIVAYLIRNDTSVMWRAAEFSQGLKQIILKNNEHNTYDTTLLYYKQIVIDSVSPTHGTIGQAIKIYGKWITSTPTVRINDSTISSFTTRNDSFCQFSIVSGYTGRADIIVQRLDASYIDSIRWDYDTIPKLDSVRNIINSLSYEYSKLAGGGFGVAYGSGMTHIDSAWLGDSALTIDSATDDSRMYFIVPAYHSRGGVDLRILADYGYRDTSAGLIYKNLHVTSLTPTGGKVGDTITMRAIWGFKTSGLAVKIDTASAVVVAGYSDTLARVVAPANPRGYNKAVETINSDNDSTYNFWNYLYDNQGRRGQVNASGGLIIGAE